jgi:hypothetical protein
MLQYICNPPKKKKKIGGKNRELEIINEKNINNKIGKMGKTWGFENYWGCSFWKVGEQGVIYCKRNRSRQSLAD